MPAFESRRVRTQSAYGDFAVNGYAALEYVGYRHNAHNILSVIVGKNKHLSQPVNGRSCVTWHLQSDKQNSQMQRKISELKVKKGSRLLLMILTGFFNMRKVKRFTAGRTDAIVADSFARAVELFATNYRYTQPT